jgi:hypothetical protein
MLRYRLARLSRPDARRAFGRTWLGVCLVGAFATLIALGPGHLFVVLTLWLVCIFAPVRIGMELLHTLGPRVRDTLRRDLERRPAAERYASRPGAALMTELLFERAVRLPRLAPPDLAGKVTDAAVGITVRAFRRGDGPGGVVRAASACYALLDQWMDAIQHDGDPGGGPPGLWNPRASIQEQWVTLRAVAALAALTKTLVSVYDDSAGRPMEGGSAIESAADSAMDYTDQVGLQLDGPPWEPAPGIVPAILRRDMLERLSEAWTAFCSAPQPAPRRLLAFLAHVPQ